eukprot:3733010-Lingulodinium_polyedra.AAC.1
MWWVASTSATLRYKLPAMRGSLPLTRSIERGSRPYRRSRWYTSGVHGGLKGRPGRRVVGAGWAQLASRRDRVSFDLPRSTER